MASSANITAETARSIARTAYIYGFPMVEGYKTLYKQAVDRSNPEFKAPFNQIGHSPELAKPGDTQFVTPNVDTPYSFLWADLRAEPIVITMPEIEPNRYYTAQLVDLYTHNFAYLGTRVFGNGGGNFMVVGPAWEGEQPDNIQAVIRCETELLFTAFRIQLFSPSDLERVQAIQPGITARPLSQFLGQPAPPAAPAIAFPPLVDDMTETPILFSYLNFLLQFAPTHPSEAQLMTQFAQLGIGAGQSFDSASLPPEIQQAITDGIADFWQQDFPALMQRTNTGELGSADFFGTREFLQNNYPLRFMGAKLGIFGNSGEETIYPTYFVDADNNKLDGSQHRYTMHFEPNQLPPVNAFWSITMYHSDTQQLVENPLQRYVLNSPMLDTFKFNQDGSLTFYFQKDSPGTDLEPNWLPAPDGLFYMIMRLYLPKPEVTNGTWKHPLLQLVR